jgi:hypothetical protein
MILTSNVLNKNLFSTENIITYWDLQNTSCYAGSGTTITDLDGTNNGSIVGTVPYTDSNIKYFSLDNTTSNYIRTNINLNSSLSPANTSEIISVFTWVYPTSNGIILSEQGTTSPDSTWHDSQIEWINNRPRFGVWQYDNVGLLNVKVYSTHNGNGTTSQYVSYPNTITEFNKLFDTTYTHTTLSWSGNIASTVPINWSTYTALTNAGLTIPNSGNYFSVEVKTIFVPAETGVYSFGINSDDGADLYIDNTYVIDYYGGHGMSGPMYGNISLIAGRAYTLRVRMQEFGGGEGLQLTWKRPSQGSYSLQSSELISGSQNIVTSSISAGLNTWHYVGFTYDGSILRAYTNGQLAGNVTINRLSPGNYSDGLYYTLGYPSATNMGAGNGGATFQLGAFHVWNSCLTDATILRNYNITKSSYGL